METDLAEISPITALDHRYIWHPFTQMQAQPYALAIVRGEGALLYDPDGHPYIDACASWWTNIHGHAQPWIAAAIARQAATLEHVIFSGFTHPAAVRLADRIVPLLPQGLEKLFFSDNGSTATEVGLKMALQYWHNLGRPRRKVLAFRHAYHGDTFGAMSVSERGLFTRPFHPLLFEVDFLPEPYPGEEKTALEALETALKNADDYAAFIYEPIVQGAAGMQMMNPAALGEMLSLAQEKGILLIADEVMTGFGRTGRMFASEYLEALPDILCMSKGITGGFLPLGLTACSLQVFDAFLSDDSHNTFYHGHSYTGNPLACAAAVANLELFEQPGPNEAIAWLSGANQAFAAAHAGNPRMHNLRSLGTVLAFELGKENSEYTDSAGQKAMEAAREQGVLLRPMGNSVYIIPPYCITPGQLQQVYGVLEGL